MFSWLEILIIIVLSYFLGAFCVQNRARRFQENAIKAQKETIAVMEKYERLMPK
jgi:hypothetical protein